MSSLEQSRIVTAEIHKARIESVREIFRDHLLAALSEARASTLDMDSTLRERLMDSVTKEFHPDGNMKDLFSDAFHGFVEALDEEIEMLTDELAMEVRRVRQAAE